MLLKWFLVSGIVFSLFSLNATEWNHESELGIVASGGNTENQTLSAKQSTGYLWDQHALSSKGSYLYGETKKKKSANSWTIGLRYDFAFNDRIGLFLGNLWEGNEFAGFDYRNHIDVGGKYDWLPKQDNYYLFSELGYRYTYEQKVPAAVLNFERKHSVRFYNEGMSKITESVSFKLWVEYLRNFSKDEDYQWNFEPSMTVLLNRVFSLKVAYLGKYSGRPALSTNKNFDWLYTTSLIAKF